MPEPDPPGSGPAGPDRSETAANLHRSSSNGPQITVRVPATSANLGPGFDALGLALTWYDDVDVRLAAGGLEVTVAGEGAATLPRDETHLIVRALRAGFDALGGQPAGLAVRCRNTIPQGRGLGSSAAAIVAGVVAARALTSDGAARMTDAAALALCTELEGHPDNVAACLLGGFTLAWQDAGGPHAVALPVADVSAVALVPAFEASTAEVRRLLPPTVPHADAAGNAGRAALLVEALGRRPELLLAATEDRLHQQYRAPAMPESAELVRTLRSAGLPAVVSGAGPTVLVLMADPAAVPVPAGWQRRELSVDRHGATALP